MRRIVFVLTCCVGFLGHTSSFAQLVYLGADEPEPKPDEIIGTYAGKIYHYADLGRTRAEIRKDMDAAYAARGATNKVITPLLGAQPMRMGAVAKFYDLVVNLSIVQIKPACDLTVTDQDVSQFISWWDREIALGHTRARPGLQMSTAASRIGWAKRQIADWKQYACVFKTFGGGNVQRTIQASSVGGTPYPDVHPARPLDSYRRLFEGLMKDGILSFPDKAARDNFFWRLEDKGNFSYFTAAEAAKVLDKPYWQGG